MLDLVKLDIGSGGFKQPGYLGMDVLPPGGNNHDIDLICDIEKERWPLPDNSVSHMFSSHCFEHVNMNNLNYIFSEMTRVAADGCKIEIWNPYAFHRDATIMSHTTYLTEETYYHICCGHQAAWGASLGGMWFIEEIRYHVDAYVVASLESLGIPVEVAINHMNNVVKEFGMFIQIDKSGRSGRQHWVFDRVTVDETSPYGGPPMRATREVNRKLLSVGQYVPRIYPKSEAAAQNGSVR